MKKAFALPLCLLFTGNFLLAQTTKQTTHVQQVWLAYFNQARFADKWGMWADVHLRTREDFATNFSTAIYRLGVTYYLNDNTRLTLGHAYINHFPAENHKNISVPEHRPWQQIQWNTRYSRVRTTQTLRLEQRYRRKVESDDKLGKGYDFNHRLRYNFLLNVPLNVRGALERGSWSYVLNDEVMFNFGKKIVYNYFDQNRFFTGVSYYINSHDNIQFGYLNVFQQLPGGNRYRRTQGIRIFYFHNLDLRKKG